MTDSTSNTNTSEVANENVKEKPKFDKLRMYFGDEYDLKLNDDKVLHILQPTIGDILEIGEQDFYSMLYVFIGNTTMYRVQLWDVGIDWNKISDYELFCMLIKTVDPNVSKTLFGDIDFTTFDAYVRKYQDGTEIPTLISEKYGMEFDEDSYLLARDYIRTMFNINPKVEKAKGKTTKQWIIQEEKDKLALAAKEEDKHSSSLLALVSFCVNHPGFKYKTSELRELGIVQFMDSVQRLQIYESTSALNSGLYSGFADLSKVDKNLFNFAREI